MCCLFNESFVLFYKSYKNERWGLYNTTIQICIFSVKIIIILVINNLSISVIAGKSDDLQEKLVYIAFVFSLPLSPEPLKLQDNDKIYLPRQWIDNQLWSSGRTLPKGNYWRGNLRAGKRVGREKRAETSGRLCEMNEESHPVWGGSIIIFLIRRSICKQEM